MAITIIDLVDRLTGPIRDAFLASINDVANDVDLAELEDAIARNDAVAIFNALNMRQEYFAPLHQALRDAYEQSGDYLMKGFVADAAREGVKVKIRFDARIPSAEEWVRRSSSELITRITDDDHRGTVRQVLTDGFEAGEGPRATALRLVGRIDKATGKRSGGILGMTAPHQRAHQTMIDVLTNDPRKYFVEDRETGELKGRWKLRDKRFDRTIKKAIRDGEKLTKEKIRQITDSYQNRLLYARGEMIARTELLQSLHQAQNQALVQLAASGDVEADAITRIWDASNDMFTRPSHAAMDGQERKLNEAFESGDGHLLMFPGDRSLNAPPEEIIQCRCYLRIDIDFVKGLRDQLSGDELADLRRAIAEEEL